MLSKEQNDLLTQTGPGTPGGDLFRRYWQPVALAEELPPGAAPLPVRILSEDLVLFRGEDGLIGLMRRRCPHRGADLSYGRIEGGAIRCLYHGWLIGRNGRCLEQPGEPSASTYKDRIRHPAYPCAEAGGLIWTYMGPGEAPPLQRFPFLSAPDERVWTTKLIQDCNYLQANEGNVDPQHLSFLHRVSAPGPKQDEYNIIGDDLAPALEVEETDFGIRIYAVRKTNAGRYVRVSNFVVPNASAFDGGPIQNPARVPQQENAYYWMHWHVPIDDVSHWKYAVAYSHDMAIDKDFVDQMIRGDQSEDYNGRRRKENRYLQDRTEMATRTFLGMGYNFYDHDRYAVESQGAISDRTTENLGASDRAIIAMRKQLLRAIDDLQAGRAPVMTPGHSGQDNPVADLVVTSQVVAADADLHSLWRKPSRKVPAS